MLPLAALRGVFTHVVDEQVTFVNVPALAAERGVGVELTTVPESDNYRSVVQLRAAMPDGEAITVSGALTGRAQVEKLVEVNGRHFDLRAEGEVIVLEYADRPGVMGRVGSLLGEAAVNIEAAQISQTTDGTDAIMLLRVDRPVDPGVARTDRRVHRSADDAARLVRLTGSKDHPAGGPPSGDRRRRAPLHGVACGSAVSKWARSTRPVSNRPCRTGLYRTGPS